ncbi:lactoylglutathione lyase family protein [Hirsutella rhossiliensis]|uniref:Lactoylglutathione lyase family protein n=1 Tax=Hirsutella rhossiliensis TaxID=111463 RepID=A0A9P8MV84_9HYPO|nr:lactoylglutathione lyase family protein [Hirsutella rhossiliensis]KAH0962027.1 lactoylglutathione lyase family protein [Hirsutella rhossiliensis]
MNDNSKPKVGEICWLEIPVHDVSRAQQLYGDVFGWVCQPEGVPHGRNGIQSMHFFNKGAVHGAFLLVMEGYQAVKYGRLDKEILPPLPTFCVDDCGETLTKVVAHGGKEQCPKTAIGGDMGYFARFTDTEGNIIGIWSQK